MIKDKAIEKQVKLLREGYSIGIYPEYVPMLCNECDRENLKFTIVNNLGYDQISLTRLGIPKPFHLASLIGFNTYNRPEWFLVDPTYGQFFENKTFKNYMFDNYEEFTTTLLKQGYIECSKENIQAYFSGFIYSKAFEKNIDVLKVYENIQNLFLENNIIHEQIYTQSKSKKLIKKNHIFK